MIDKRGTSPSKQQQIRRSASVGHERMNSLTLRGSATVGIAPFSDCFEADSRMRRRRSGLNTLRSECSPITGTISSKPSSVAFSANHS